MGMALFLAANKSSVLPPKKNASVSTDNAAAPALV